MISFVIYLLILSGLIYGTRFFGLFKDEVVSAKLLSVLFLGKALAVPVFYLSYFKLYGGIEKFDTGKFHHDVVVLSEFAKTDFRFFIKLLLGFQDDTPGSLEYLKAVQNTYNWDNGTLKDYLYNDNRILIRTHLLLNFLAGGSYLTHALFNCFLSFVGIFFIYKTFKDWFRAKEIYFLLVICFFPSLWFYTGAMLKEGIALLILGGTLLSLKHTITEKLNLKVCFVLFVMTVLSFLLKPYLLVFALLCFLFFFWLQSLPKVKYKPLLFLLLMLIVGISANMISITLKERSLTEAMLQHHRRFVGMTKGGIFLSGNGKYIRLKNDTSQIVKLPGNKSFYKIKEHVSFMFWNGSNRRDTFYCKTNADTLSEYSLVYIIPESQSNIDIPVSDPLISVFRSLYYTLYYPDFFQAKNLLQKLASFENLLVIFSLIICIYGLLRKPKDKFLPFVFLFFALCLCVLIGITAPNSGAIFRYRSPALVFILLGAVYFIEKQKAEDESDSGSPGSHIQQ